MSSENIEVKTARNPPERKALGRGLAALLGDSEYGQRSDNMTNSPYSQSSSSGVSDQAAHPGLLLLNLADISANPDQPRKHFNKAKLEEHSLSRREHGLVQPVVVKRLPNGAYQLIAGERRWRAAQLAGLEKIPALVRETKVDFKLNDLASLVENIQREELSPIELAVAYDRMMKEHSFTQETLAEKLGVSRVSVANCVRLLRLPESIKNMISAKTLSEGHSRALLALNDESHMTALADEIISQGLTVRDVELRVRKRNEPTQQGSSRQSDPRSGAVSASSTRNAEVAALEEELRNRFGTKVVLRGNPVRGTIELYYAGKDSLNRLLHQLRGASK